MAETFLTLLRVGTDLNGNEKGEEPFQSLGGYQEGSKVTFKVLSNATGVGLDTKETWKRTK
jgi:hypothetical protein